MFSLSQSPVNLSDSMPKVNSAHYLIPDNITECKEDELCGVNRNIRRAGISYLKFLNESVNSNCAQPPRTNPGNFLKLSHTRMRNE